MRSASTFRLGTGVGLVSDNTLAVLEPMNAELAKGLWELIASGAGIDELLERLSTTGLRSLGSFAMVQFEGHDVRVVVRGRAGAVIRSGEAEREITAESVRTWHEEVVESAGAVQVFLGKRAESDPRLPFRLVAGLVPSDRLRRDPLEPLELQPADFDAVAEVSTESVLPSGEPTDASDPLELLELLADEPVPPAAEPEPAEPQLQVDESDPLADAMAAADAVARPTADAVLEAPRADSVVPDVVPAASTTALSHDPAMTRQVDEFLPEDAAATPASASAVVPAPAVGDPADEVDEYDQIWGRTMARSVQAAAVHQAAEADAAASPAEPRAASPALTPPAAAPAAAALTPLAPAAPDPVPPSEPGSPMISSVPGAGHPVATPPLASPVANVGVPLMGDHDGRTMTKAQIQAMRAAAAAGSAGPGPAGPSMGGPTVQALVCPGQHANPPQLSRCRVCGQSLPAAVVMIARPTLGTLRFSNGTTAQLDKPALIGRNPKLEGALPSEVPNIVRLDVGQGLSRTHAAVRLEGWQVLLDDLNSANGTIVQLPGREARRLHPGEPVLLEHGTTIDFGGEITCVVELS